jgi:hypothetical protein
MLDTIRRLTVDGVAPSYRQIAAAMGLKTVSGVCNALKRMRDSGLVHFTSEHRSLVIIGDCIPPARLHRMGDAALNETAAHIAGVIASRRGDFEAATTFRRIADALLAPPKARGRAA